MPLSPTELQHPPPLPPEVLEAEAEAAMAEAEEAEEADALLNSQIRAIMLQHAEDCKRMSHADAGRLAMQSLTQVQAVAAAAHAPLRAI